MNRMKQLREERGITMKEAAFALNMPYTTYVNYEKGMREPNSENLIKIANFYNTSIDYLLYKSDTSQFMGWESESSIPTAKNILPLPKTKKVPLIGTIACGTPILAEENIDGYVDAPDHIQADFCLRCQGDSMINARIMDGDVVLIRRQPDVDDGQIAAVLIDDEATLKRVYHIKNGVTLIAENPAYSPITIIAEDCLTVRIIGKAIAFISGVK